MDIRQSRSAICSRTDARHVDRALRALAEVTCRGIVELLAHGETPQAELATRIENMTPGKLFSKGLAAIPTLREIAVHWIIAVLRTGPIGEGNDGVVEYTSAHIEGVESEFILPNVPNTIQVPHRRDRRGVPHFAPEYRCRVVQSSKQARSTVIVVMPYRSRDHAPGRCRVLRVGDPRKTASLPGANLAPLGSAKS